MNTRILLSLFAFATLTADALAMDCSPCVTDAIALADTLQSEEPTTSDADWQVWTIELTDATIAGTHKYGNLTLKRGLVDRSVELWVEAAATAAGDFDLDALGCVAVDERTALRGADEIGVIPMAGAKHSDAYFVRCDRTTMTGERVELYLSIDAEARGDTIGCAVVDESQAVELLDIFGGTVGLVGVEPDEIDLY